MPRNFHEYTTLEYWQDYKEEVSIYIDGFKSAYQYVCPDYRFERLMQEIEDLKKEVLDTRSVLASAQRLIHHSSVDPDCLTAERWSEMWTEHTNKQNEFYAKYPEGEVNEKPN